MTKLGDLKVRTAILCDDVRREQDTNKGFLIGVYSGDLIVPELPADLLLAFYIEVDAPEGVHNLEFRLSGPQEAEGILKARMANKVAGIGTIATPRIGVHFEKEGTFRIDGRIAGARWANLLSKKVILRVPPNASPLPSEQSEIGAPETSSRP